MATLTKTKQITLLFLVSCILFAIVGQYAGGAFFLKETSIPLRYLSYSTLYDYWGEYINHRDFKGTLGFSAIIAASTTIIPLSLMLFFIMVSHKKEELHGSARFANEKELAKSGLFPKEKERKQPSILLGKMNEGRFKGKFVELMGSLFVGLGAGTRMGKGVSMVLPNLVTYIGSVVVLDIKLENFTKSGGFRKKHNHEVFLYSPDGYNPDDVENPDGCNPNELRTHGWNPFDYVRRHKAFRIGDILTITTSLYPLTGDKNDVWNRLAGKLFKGLALWLLDTENITKQTPTLPYLFSLTGVEGGLDKWMKREISQGYLSDDAILEFNNYIATAEETKGSILSSLVSPLAIFSDKVVAASVSHSSFNFSDLRRKKMAIYVGIQPGNLGKFSTLINLFFEQLINENTRVLPEQDPTLKEQCLLLMDEFTSIGRVSQIAKSISFMAGYNLRFLLIYQNEAQLEDKYAYGKEGARNILSNLGARVIFPPKEVDDSVKRLSETLGTKTVKVKNKSISRGKHPSTTRNSTPHKRALMMPHEIVELGMEKHETAPLGKKSILLKENQRAFIMDKIFYFDEPILNERVEYSKNNIPTIPLIRLQN
ncbi:type IV secretory system conjugative DNA transfer family protein [uncultured Shewanella sp.]|uniref:type IV secretory system conjugative DNA transfer family protein n=1 Tax=uncultured Shewanella sp. TaxID=173975 RepID=UPI002620F92E|nr:type IV secretory system conjugative DNA transfer family protein [uncultured Shewanella sp.]